MYEMYDQKRNSINLYIQNELPFWWLLTPQPAKCVFMLNVDQTDRSQIVIIVHPQQQGVWF